MNRGQAIGLIKLTFEEPFNKDNFVKFIANLLKKYDITKALEPRIGIQGITEKYLEFIGSWERIGRYVDEGGKKIDILVVKLRREFSLYHARSAQRNFVAEYLSGKLGTNTIKDAALVAFVAPNDEDWRFSLVKLDYTFQENPLGKIKVEKELTPAKRWSFLVGKNEKSHTAQSRFLPLLENDYFKPTLSDLEKAFDVEVVTKEFFEKYRDLFIKTKLELDKLVQRDLKVSKEFKIKNISTVDFAKKLLGQITFLYFLQKKGWFGVEKGKPWTTGPKDFIRKLFNKEFVDYKNFYNDILEPLFYEALRIDRSDNEHYYNRFNCKIPFLNGGLFDPPNGFDWVNVDVLLPNELFSNRNKTKEGDVGDGILDVFDRYNFTVNEEEPLEKEVALDPELLGKIYEKLNAIRQDNFDQYVKVLNSGKKGEEAKFNKEYGVYYTPPEIVHYMCQESLINYLETEIKDKVNKKEIEEFVRHVDFILENERIAIKKNEKISIGEQKQTKYEYKISQSIIENAKEIDKILSDIAICDPAVWSGAFPIGMMHQIVKLRQLLAIYLNKEINSYDLKRHCIENSLYGVDIDAGAVEICKLRFWLSMIVDEDDFHNIKPLPNLDYKVVCGDSLLGFPENWNSPIGKEIQELMDKYFSETNPLKKLELKQKIDEKIKWRLEKSQENFGYKINFDFKLFFPKVFREKGGFDIVISNPPYVSTKGVNEELKISLKKYYGFADDLYNHFFFKGFQILKNNGILTYITSKTYWTIQTKKNLRDLLLENTILQIFDTANPFESAMVDTSVIIVKKSQPEPGHQITFLDGKNNITQPEKYTIQQNDYTNVPNKVIFIPTDFNKKIYQKLAKKVNELLIKWWDKISTSKNIEKYKKELEIYRKSLKPGDITLLGLITEGGQGLATANNGKYIGVLEGTKWADKVRNERPEKLLLVEQFCKKENIKSKADAQAYLNNLKEKEIRQLFDELKEKYGRDVFGQGWIYRIVSYEEIVDVDYLTDDEKLNGIRGDKTFVPYDKGDKDGNRWYAPTPYYIDWSRENVKFLKENSGKKGEGMPVVRNPQFYFREGFCWNNVTGEKIICRVREKSVHSTEAMTFMSVLSNLVSDKYLICLMNSTFFGKYKNLFLNVSVHLTTGDAKEFPIIIPTLEQLRVFESLCDRAIAIQKQKFNGVLTNQEAQKKLDDIQKELDELVLELYGLKE
ncbi:MAG: BREX-1 system adenine-specific DNA-methyltransferase PglX [bacterium]|nr:BREX-1 system adenine-specific DNA-methyltransferase PglX [bacterium]